MRPAALSFGDLSIEGRSRAGDETWFRVHPPGLAFDSGRGAGRLAGARDIFLSHCHLDHALGLPYVLSQRESATRVFCPAPAAPALLDFLGAAERMEQQSYRYELVPMVVGDRVKVGRDLEVEAFETDHVVPSLGFHLLRRKRRLAPGLAGLSGAELLALRERDIATEEVVEEALLSYCGDTGPGVFALSPRIFESRVLLLECTFLGAEQGERAARYKHLQLDDIARHAGDFRNVALVLHHLSRRYRVDDLRREVERRLPGLASRVHLLVEGDP